MPALARAALALAFGLSVACQSADDGKGKPGTKTSAGGGSSARKPPRKDPASGAAAGTADGGDAAQAEPIDPAPIADPTPHDFSARDMLAMDRISDHQVSPDGKTIAFVRRVTDLEYDKGRTDIWTVPVSRGKPSRLTTDPGSDHTPRWSPDGKTLYFLSGRSGSSQVWRMPAGGGTPSQVTDLPLSVGGMALSPDGAHLLLALEVFVDCGDLPCTKRRLEARKADKRTGFGYDRVFVRHWDHYRDGRRSHVFSLPVSGQGNPVDLMKGMDADCPSKPFGGMEEVTVSPDSGTVVFTARDVGREEPWSTNFDLFAVPLAGGEAPRKLTDNPAWDTHPVFSPDGGTLVYAAMARPGYESDRFALTKMAWPDGAPEAIVPDWDRSARGIVFEDDGHLLVTAQDVGQVSLFRVDLAGGAEPTKLASDGTIGGPARVGDAIVFSRHDLTAPADLYRMPSAGGEPKAITAINAEKIASARMGRAEQWSFRGAAGDEVYAYLVEPVERAEGEKVPIAFLIHGGPQGSFGNKFHYRWNPQVYAAAGYAVLMIDFHGSTGYGQDFTDAIRKDWGGKPLLDLQKGLASALEQWPWLDSDRACALGASYGGFMINWIAGNWPEGFACLVNHDGVFDQRSMYYSTEELWFPEWENGGPYFQDSTYYERWNPVRFVDRWKTPMLVIHGSLDYRVPEEQGLAAFNALQRRGIESRYLRFPDENHWVLRPSNSLQWHQEVLGWLDRHARPEAAVGGTVEK